MRFICKIHGQNEFVINTNGDGFCAECIKQATHKYINSKMKFDVGLKTDVSMGTKVPFSMGTRLILPRKIITK